jgi:hypothetical protein
MPMVKRAFLGVIALLAVLMAGAAQPSAATLDIVAGFTGTITELNDPSSVGGLTVGQQVQGTLRLGLLPDSPDFSGSGFNGFSAATASLDLFGPTLTGGGYVINEKSGFLNRLLFVFDADLAVSPLNEIYYPMSFALDFATTGSGAPLLTSLIALPSSEALILQLLGGTPNWARGSFIAYVDPYTGFSGKFSFDSLNIQAGSPAVTPIPAALPLFASALAGLGAAAWRRRKANSGAAASGAAGNAA